MRYRSVLIAQLALSACAARPSPTSPGPEFEKDVSLGKYVAPAGPAPARGPATSYPPAVTAPAPAPAAAVAPGVPTAPAPEATTSGFEQDADGWMVIGDVKSVSRQPDFYGHGGNPGGLISVRDNMLGGIMYFVAPAKYYGDKSDAYGRALRFDLKIDQNSSPFAAYGVMLASPSLTLVTMLDSDPVPVNSWHSYSIPLDPRGHWKVVPDRAIRAGSDFATARDASDAEIRTVLANLEVLRIRAEFNTGRDTDALDNVKFGE